MYVILISSNTAWLFKPSLGTAHKNTDVVTRRCEALETHARARTSVGAATLTPTPARVMATTTDCKRLTNLGPGQVPVTDPVVV